MGKSMETEGRMAIRTWGGGGGVSSNGREEPVTVMKCPGLENGDDSEACELLKTSE
jgi:hypothetical protein